MDRAAAALRSDNKVSRKIFHNYFKKNKLMLIFTPERE